MSRGMWVLIACLTGVPAWAQEGPVAAEPAAPAGEASIPAAGSGVAGRLVSLPTAWHTRFDAYLAGAEDAAVGVLLVHDRWGLNGEVRAWADRVAALGFRVLAVDLYDGRPARGDAQFALAVWRSIDPVWIEADLDAALAFLRRTQGRIVAMAWGKGVQEAAGLLTRHPGAVRALVTYYDSETLTAGDRPGKLTIPVLDVLTPRTLAGPPAAGLPAQAAADAWIATEQFLTRLSQ